MAGAIEPSRFSVFFPRAVVQSLRVALNASEGPSGYDGKAQNVMAALSTGGASVLPSNTFRPVSFDFYYFICILLIFILFFNLSVTI